MDLNRRSFFGVAVASPFAAKEAAARVIEQAAQMEAGGIGLYSDSLYTGIAATGDDGPMRSIWDAIKDIGIPEWKREDLRDDARRSRTLDPDIASMKSFSLNAKMRMQWERNYQTLVDKAVAQTKLERVKQAFFEAHPDISEY
ncbi:MAG: hypothetical protein NWT00_01000 [Beijerinckiaceae bacterium]|jgi:hypothetical protein|nr:hypothetical protein [Beijerinckiaceae bacterium]